MAFEDFTPFRVAVGDVDIFGVKGGSGPPLLLLHGHPQSHLIWQRCAAQLAEHFTVIATDLRGYGASGKPPSDADHRPYSKRAMAADQVAVMRHFGFERFLVCAHDRGARVAHRMALDHPDAVERLMLLDIAPTLAMYEATDRAFATPLLPLVLPDPAGAAAGNADRREPGRLCRRGDGQPSRGPRAVRARTRSTRIAARSRSPAPCMRCARTTGRRRASISNTIAPTSSAATRSAVRCACCGASRGVIEKCFDALAEWRHVARDVSGRALPCGHYIPEEASEELVTEMLSFFEAVEQ